MNFIILLAHTLCCCKVVGLTVPLVHTQNSKSISEMLEAILSSRICGPLILVWYSLPSFPNQIPSMGFLIKGLTWTSLKPESLHRRTGREVKRYASHPSGTFRYVVAMASRSSSGSSPSRGPGRSYARHAWRVSAVAAAAADLRTGCYCCSKMFKCFRGSQKLICRRSSLYCSE